MAQMGPVLFHLVIKMSKTYCGVVAAYQALEVKIKYLTQNETFVLLYRSYASDYPRIWVFKRWGIMTMKTTITVSFMTFFKKSFQWLRENYGANIWK